MKEENKEEEWIIIDERDLFNCFFVYHIPCKERSKHMPGYRGFITDFGICTTCYKKAPNYIMMQWKLLDEKWKRMSGRL